MRLRFDPAGQTTLLTGASSGIGLALARVLAAAGARLVITARREELLDKLASEIAAGGGEAPVVIAGDLTQTGGPARIFAAAEAAAGPIDLLVNNAGRGWYGNFADAGAPAAEQIMQLNITALVRLTSLALRGMIERRHGAVLNVASVAALAPLPRMSTYAASKAYVLNFSEALHHELRPLGILVSCLCPGRTRETEFSVAAGYPPTEPAWRDHLVLPASTVAAAGLAGLKNGRMTVVVGGRNRALATISRLLPRSLVARITARAMLK